jgi:hypothetical protein
MLSNNVEKTDNKNDIFKLKKTSKDSKVDIKNAKLPSNVFTLLYDNLW